MKKIVTLSFLLFSALSNAQSLVVWALDATASNTVTLVNNGAVLSYTTSASNPTITATTDVTFKFTNTSATTNTYSVVRADRVLNPGAKAHFCFGDLGSCYDETVYEPASDFCVLNPGDTTTGGRNLITDLDEANTIGYSAVYYKLFNKATGKTGADTLSFTIKYNQYLKVDELSGWIACNSDVYPNPSGGQAAISIVLTHDCPVKVQVHNSIGTLLHSDNEQLLAGKNNLQVDCSQYPSGLYFVTVIAGDSKITKRLVIN